MKWTFKNSQIYVTSHRKACIICGKMKYIELEKCYICPCFLWFLEVGWGEIVCVNIDPTFSPLLSCSLTVCPYIIELNPMSGFLVPCIVSGCWLCLDRAPLFRLPIPWELDLS